MDQEFRSALRLLQRAGGSFEQLSLHEFLDHEGLAALAHHCIVARLRLLDTTFSVHSAPKQAYKVEMSKAGHLLFSTKTTDQPRMFYTTKRWVYTNYGLGQLPLGDHPLETLPQQITQILASDWQTVTRSGYTFRGPQHSEATLQGIGIIALSSDQLSVSPYRPHQAYYLANIWKETPQSVYYFQKKKLREQGKLSKNSV